MIFEVRKISGNHATVKKRSHEIGKGMQWQDIIINNILLIWMDIENEGQGRKSATWNQRLNNLGNPATFWNVTRT